MLESLLPYYERELGHLRQLSGEFARRYPKIAGRLQMEGDQCEDPHTERMIESFAFLAARIHKKLDDEYPEVATSFLNVLYPHYLQPIPSATIVQFECDPQRPEIAKRYRVERGQPVHAPAMQGVVCKFRSAYPVDLYPLSLTEAKLELTSGSPYLRQLAPEAAAVLTLEFHTHGGLALNAIGLQSLRFFLDGEPALMHLLYEMLLSNVQSVSVGDGSEDPARTRKLPAASLKAVGFGRDEGLLDYDERSFMGYRLLTEYFCYPDKFLFVDLLQLDKAVARLDGDKLVLRLLLDQYPDSERHNRLQTQLQAQHMKLGCTPIVNLFTQPGEPIRVTHQKASYPVLVDGRKQQAYEAIQIKRVVRVEKSGDGESSEEVPPFYAIRHGSEKKTPRFYWHASRERSPRQGDKGTDLELHLADLEFNAVRPATEVLSLELLCSNRDLPEQIPFGGDQSTQRTDFSCPAIPWSSACACCASPAPASAAAGARGAMAPGVASVAELHVHRRFRLRRAAGNAGAVQPDRFPVNVRQIQGVVGIESQPAVTRVSGRDFSGFVRGSEIRLTLDPDYYVGGSVYLFAAVLERFFALYCAPNSFTRLRVHAVQQDEALASWPARAGEALVI